MDRRWKIVRASGNSAAMGNAASAVPADVRRSILDYVDPARDVPRYARTSRFAADDVRQRGATHAFDVCCHAPLRNAELLDYVDRFLAAPVGAIAARQPLTTYSLDAAQRHAARDEPRLAPSRGYYARHLLDETAHWVVAVGATRAAFELNVFVIENSEVMRQPYGTRKRLRVPEGDAWRADVNLWTMVTTWDGRAWRYIAGDEATSHVYLADPDTLARLLGVAPPDAAARATIAREAAARIMEAVRKRLLAARADIESVGDEVDPVLLAVLDPQTGLPDERLTDAAFADAGSGAAIDVPESVAYAPVVWNYVAWRRSVGTRCADALRRQARAECVAHHAARFGRALRPVHYTQSGGDRRRTESWLCRTWIRPHLAADDLCTAAVMATDPNPDSDDDNDDE